MRKMPCCKLKGVFPTCTFIAYSQDIPQMYNRCGSHLWNPILSRERGSPYLQSQFFLQAQWTERGGRACTALSVPFYGSMCFQLYSELPFKWTERAMQLRPLSTRSKSGVWELGDPSSWDKCRSYLWICHKCLRWEYSFKEQWTVEEQSIHLAKITRKPKFPFCNLFIIYMFNHWNVAQAFHAGIYGGLSRALNKACVG